MRHATISLTLTGDIPAGLNAGDELDISGRITIHSVTASLINVSGPAGTAYVPGERDFEAYANDIKFVRVDGD